MNGVLLLDKPKGISSFAAMSAVKRRLGLKKVGFLGTLDPAASGLLVLLCGTHTKLADKLHCGNKTYISTFMFGISTDTLDLEGQVVERTEIIPTREQIENAIKSFVGEVEIEVPKFSAVHIGGKRAYELARKNIEFISPRRVVNVMRFELVSQKSDSEFVFEIECQTGTYIRSLADALAKSLNSLAIASEIRRTRVNNFEIKNAKSIDNIGIDDLVILS